MHAPLSAIIGKIWKHHRLEPFMDERDECRRPEGEDDDGYDPYSDRPAADPQYEEDPWR